MCRVNWWYDPVLLTQSCTPCFSFLDTYPDINLRILSDERVFKLEYGEAHLAIRLGKMPDEPDNIVIPLDGKPKRHIRQSRVFRSAWKATIVDLAHHSLDAIGDSVRAPFARWLHALPTPPREVVQQPA